MRRAVLIALVCALALPPTADAARRQVPQGWLGVVVDGPLTEPAFAGAAAEWDRLAGSGAEAVRAAVYWQQVQPNGPADANFAAYGPDRPDRRPARPRRAAGRPGHARLGGAEPRRPRRRRRATPTDFARFLTALVTRYGPNGSLWAEHPEVSRQPIRSWQIWNEPNLTRYWNVAPWAPSYVALLKRADKALKAADPGSQTVLAGLPNESWKALDGDLRRRARAARSTSSRCTRTRASPKNVVRIVKIVRREMAAPRRRQAADLGHRAVVARRRRARREQHGDFETTDAGPGDAARGRAAAARRRSARRSGSGACTGTRGCRSKGITDSAFDYSGLRRLRGGQVVDAPALTVFTRLARRLQGCAKRPATHGAAADARTLAGLVRGREGYGAVLAERSVRRLLLASLAGRVGVPDAAARALIFARPGSAATAGALVAAFSVDQRARARARADRRPPSAPRALAAFALACAGATLGAGAGRALAARRRRCSSR